MGRSIGLAAVFLTFGMAATPASADSALKLSLDFNLEGGHSPYQYAVTRGFFKEEGIDAQVDPSSGSGDAIARVAGGAYAMGIADIGTVIEFTSRFPDTAPKIVMPIFDTAANVLVALKKTGVTTLADMVGRKLVTGQSDGTSRLWPAFAKSNGLDITKVQRIVADVRLREAMLLRGEADATIGFDYSITFNLRGQGIAPEALTVIDLRPASFELYGNALIASRALIANEPAIVAKAARALARGWVAAIKDPAASVASAVARDPLLNASLETERLRYLLSRHIVTPATQAGGFAVFDPKKLEGNIQFIAEGFELARKPTAAEVFDGRFLPPLADRKF